MLLRYAIGSALRRIRLDRELTLRTVADSARISLTGRDSRQINEPS